MNKTVLLLTWTLASFVIGPAEGMRKDAKKCFSKDFKFGVATASYQIEGAWNVDGKGESIWDRYTHTHPERVFDHTSGDVADDSYHLFKEDVKLMQELGVHYYRFSISWPRILPNGLSNNVSQAGVDYYMALIEELHRHQIAPVVTMYHWDLPQALQDLGGWTNPIIADYFEDYARMYAPMPMMYAPIMFAGAMPPAAGWGPPPSSAGWGPPPAAAGWGPPPAPGGWGPPPPAAGWGPPPAAAVWGPPPAAAVWCMPPQHVFIHTVLFSTFGHKVHMWITFNEPLSFCGQGYGGDDAPGARASGTQDYMCGHNVLRAHARAYRLYEREFRQEINGTSIGQVFITLDFCWMEPATTSEEDKDAAETARQFFFGWFAHPIFSAQGDYPPEMRRIVDDMSKRQNYSRSRLPTFTQEEIEALKGSSDLLGLNHYTTQLASKGSRRFEEVSFYSDMGVTLKQNPEWPKSHSFWLRVVPWGFRKTLNWIKTTYNNPIIAITENGISTGAGLKDPTRLHYMTSYLAALHAAVTKDGCNVIAYTHWSLLDNFEWMRGYSERFGLYEVDFTSANRTRSPRLSAKLYKQIIKTGCLPS